MDRREFISIVGGASTMLLVAGGISSCVGTYRPKLINKVWNEKFDFKTDDRLIRTLQLVRCGIMAPSSYNTQPWLFRIIDNGIELLPDFSRSLPVADSKNRELFISLGCCLGNILSAAPKFRFHADYSVDIQPGSENIKILIKLEDKKDITSGSHDIFPSIIERRTTRSLYTQKNVGPDIIKSFSEDILPNQVAVSVNKDKKDYDIFLDYLKEANRLLYENKNYTDELKKWMRFSDAETEEKLDGLYSRAMGENSTTRALGNMYFDLFITPATRNQSDEKMINSSSALISFFSKESISDWIETGRQIEHTLLNITKSGIKYAFHNQSCQVEVLRKDFASDFNHKGLMPQSVIRIGYADYLPRAPRRQVKDVIIK